MSQNGMIPGQEPYTLEEAKRLHDLLTDACAAEEQCTEEELEAAARRLREEEKP